MASNGGRYLEVNLWPHRTCTQTYVHLHREPLNPTLVWSLPWTEAFPVTRLGEEEVVQAGPGLVSSLGYLWCTEFSIICRSLFVVY